MTLADVQEFADFVSVLLAPASQARILAALRSLFAFGHQVGYLPFDVGRPVKLPARRDERAERILSADDVHSMIAHAKKGRDRGLIRVLYVGGLRVTEAVGLTTRDLIARDDGSEATGQLAVFGKGAKTRPVLVPEGLFAELSALALADPDAPLFRSQKKGQDGAPRAITARQAERIVKQAARKAGLKNASEVSPHWLRHAHASHAMDRGAKIHLVQATLGHSDISTTGRYLHARPTSPPHSTWAREGRRLSPAPISLRDSTEQATAELLAVASRCERPAAIGAENWVAYPSRRSARRLGANLARAKTHSMQGFLNVSFPAFFEVELPVHYDFGSPHGRGPLPHASPNGASS